MAGKGTKLIANNKKAYHDYFIEDKYEAGIVLHGTEVKSLRMGKCSIKESFIHADHGEIYIEHMHIALMRKATFSTKTRFVQESFCCINARLRSFWDRFLRKVIRSCRCRCISRTAL